MLVHLSAHYYLEFLHFTWIYTIDNSGVFLHLNSILLHSWLANVVAVLRQHTI